MRAALAVCATLILIAALHFYWAAGGAALKGGAIPSANGTPRMSPGTGTTALVGTALLGVAAIVASTAGLLPAFLPIRLLRAASGLIALVFCARAIGEFRYLGFFKREYGSVFAARDTYIYSPLCLLLAVLIGIVASGRAAD